jgi:hypothetical protein
MRASPSTRKKKIWVKKDAPTETTGTTPKKDPEKASETTTTTPEKATETTTTTPRKDDGKAPSARKNTSPPSGRPPTKQSIRSTTRSRDTTVREQPPKIRPVWPKIGVGEKTSDGHIAAVRNTWDLKTLFDLWVDLANEDEPRWDLIKTVQDQLIRNELREMMGGNIATRAYIQVDGEIDTVTQTRDVNHITKADTPLRRGQGTAWERGVWNHSLEDAEVDTIRDIQAWADRQTPESLAGRQQIIIQIPGVSGPCDGCKQRLAIMADGILAGWVKKGVPQDQLPQLRIESYYGNPSRVYNRSGFFSRNGWSGDPTPPELNFINWAGRDQPVQAHLMYPSPPPVETATSQELVATDV